MTHRQILSTCFENLRLVHERRPDRQSQAVLVGYKECSIQAVPLTRQHCRCLKSSLNESEFEKGSFVRL